MAVMATHLTRVLATNVYTPTATADRMNVTNVRIANACVAVNVSEKHTYILLQFSMTSVVKSS